METDELNGTEIWNEDFSRARGKTNVKLFNQSVSLGNLNSSNSRGSNVAVYSSTIPFKIDLNLSPSGILVRLVNRPSQGITQQLEKAHFALVKEFNERAERWKRETSFQSSLFAKFMHEDYQAIMVMGTPVIPLILNRLQRAPEHWFWALKFLAKRDFAQKAEKPSDAAKMWLKWGKDKGFIS